MCRHLDIRWEHNSLICSNLIVENNRENQSENPTSLLLWNDLLLQSELENVPRTERCCRHVSFLRIFTVCCTLNIRLQGINCVLSVFNQISTFIFILFSCFNIKKMSLVDSDVLDFVFLHLGQKTTATHWSEWNKAFMFSLKRFS